MAIRQALSLAAILAVVLPAADWLNFRGDAELSGWQKHETILTPANVSKLKVIWKLKLTGDLQTPVILGHWVTHRGTKELVVAAGASGAVYAVDADLGRLFWQRQLDSAQDGCGGGVTAAPVLAPGPGDVDDDEDVRQAVRPVYVLAGNGSLYRLHPTTGADFEPPLAFLPPKTTGSMLYAQGDRMYAVTASCGGAPGPVLALDLKNSGKREAVTVSQKSTAAIWQDGWTYRTNANGIEGVQNSKRVWTFPAMVLPAPPVVANGVVYALSRGSKSVPAVLYGLDAETGKQLYASGSLIGSSVVSSGLAVANGHVCFGTGDGTLYCFGFPVDL